MSPPARTGDVARRLRTFWKRKRRDLPWRTTKDPYAVWISEVMLQQTTVATALSRYPIFLERFPSVFALAAAEEREVLAAWSGLGYYSRARNLRRAAREVVRRGGFPKRARELEELPGVGPYTAAAVASIAFGERVAVVDGNVARVLSRLFAARLDPRTPGGMARLRALAETLLPARNAGDHNQALMDLGATVCTPRAPRCERCPLDGICRARARGHEERYPARSSRRAVRRLRLAAGVALRRGRLALFEDRHLVPGHLAPLLVPLDAQADAAAALRDAWPAATGRRASAISPLGSLSHAVLDRRYRIEVFAVTEAPGASPGAPRVRLAAPDDLARVPHGGVLRKIVKNGWVANGRKPAPARRV